MKKIIHIDMDCFYAAVEMRDDPTLVGRPLAVGGQPDKRGVVATCNYEARAFGIHSAMAMSQAVRRCPDLMIVPLRMSYYRDVSRQILSETSNLNILKPTTRNLERTITLPIVGGDYYLQAGAFSRRASADRWIRSQNGAEEFRVAKKINGFWVVLLGPFSESDAKRQQDLKATEDKKYLILDGGDLDPLWIF